MNISIVDLIATELKRIFPRITLYKENQRAGFKEPAFFVEKIMTQVTPELMDYQFRKYHYQLVYFPEPYKPRTDMERVEEILLDQFTKLDQYASIRNREFSQSSDNTLQMTFEVWIRAYPEDTAPKQGSIKVKSGVKNEQVYKKCTH